LSENPYEAPKSSSQGAVGVLSGKREDLRSVATYQKGIIICIAIYLFSVIAQFAVPIEFRLFVSLGVMFVGLIGAVFVFLLAIKVYGTALGILYGILCLIPCIGLIVLLIVNSRATNILKQNGIKVGLFGANLADI